MRNHGFRLWVCCLTAKIVLAAGCIRADSYFWQGSTSRFQCLAGSWNPSGVPSGINAINDSNSNNVVLIRPGDPVWSPWDILLCGAMVLTRQVSYLQTGSTNIVNGWFRLGASSGSTGYYMLSNGVVNVLLQSHVGEAGSGVLTIAGGTYNVGQN